MSSSKRRSTGFHIQERDIALLCGLFECRVMTAKHVAALHFDGHAEYAKKRLQQLKAAGHISARRCLPSEPAILFLARKGLQLLRERNALADFPAMGLRALERRANVSEATIPHEIAVMDVKSAFHEGFKSSETFQVTEFTTWPLLNEFEAASVSRPPNTVQPDGFIRIHQNQASGSLAETTFFLEVDRSTEKLDTLIAKATSYLDYYRSGGFAERNGADRTAYKDFPFRVLIVLQSAERRNNVAARLLQQSPPILTQVCLSTLEEVKRDPMGAIWIRPLEYRAAAEGTRFDTARRRDYAGYRRDTSREAHVEKTARRIGLFGTP